MFQEDVKRFLGIGLVLGNILLSLPLSMLCGNVVQSLLFEESLLTFSTLDLWLFGTLCCI